MQGGMMGGGMMGGEEQAEAPSDPVAIMRDVISLIQQYLQVEPDEEDKLQGSKILQLAQQLLAKDQADKDAAMGGQNTRILRKAG